MTKPSWIPQLPGHASCLLALVALLGCAAPKPAGNTAPLPRLLLDMVHHNPGEAKTPTVFLDPTRLKAWGYNGNVPRVFVQCAVTFDAFDKDIFPADSKERAWVTDNAREIETLVAGLKAQGLPCYPFTDFIVLPRSLIAKYRTEICDEKGRVDIFRPKTKEVLRAMLDEIFTRFPDLGGLTLRHGETYLHDTPYHAGGNPILRGVESHVELLNFLRAEICVKRGKLLIYRTWDFGQMHDQPALYLGVTERVAPHPKLIFSIKHQEGDFHRLSRFNPCLGIGAHRQIVEVQCQLEAYGKGAHPYYNGQGVIEGWEEYAAHSGRKGLRDLVGDPRFAGVWTWSRGGGWRGPYLSNEFWIELNTYVISHWAQNPARSEEDVFNEFARDIAGIRDAENLARFRRIALLSAAGTLRAQNSRVHKLWVWWTRDQYFSDLTGPLQDVLKAGQMDVFLQEKADATANWKEIETLARELRLPDVKRAEFIRVSSTYGRIKCEIIEQYCRVLLFGLNAQAKQAADSRVAEAVAAYDRLWTEWRQLRADHPDACATLYTDKAFSFDGGVPGEGWGMGDVVNRFRGTATCPK